MKQFAPLLLVAAFAVYLGGLVWLARRDARHKKKREEEVGEEAPRMDARKAEEEVILKAEENEVYEKRKAAMDSEFRRASTTLWREIFSEPRSVYSLVARIFAGYLLLEAIFVLRECLFLCIRYYEPQSLLAPTNLWVRTFGWLWTESEFTNAYPYGTYFLSVRVVRSILFIVIAIGIFRLRRWSRFGIIVLSLFLGISVVIQIIHPATITQHYQHFVLGWCIACLLFFTRPNVKQLFK